MVNHKYRIGTPVGFLSSATNTPNSAPAGPQPYGMGPGAPPGIGAPPPPRPPFPANPQSMGGMPNYPGMPPGGGSSPFASQFTNPGTAMTTTNPSSSGLGGMLQNLLNGSGNLNFASIISNVQKLAGIMNQAGTVVKNLGPMLQLLTAFGGSGSSSDDDQGLFDSDSGSETRRKKRRKKRRRKRRRGTSYKRASRKSAKKAKSRKSASSGRSKRSSYTKRRKSS